ncbi:MAG: hydrogenase maturation protease [Bacteroidota bacterium]
MDRYSILVLALGNEIMGDDAVGIAAGRPLLERFGEDISIIAAPVAGFALIDFLEGYTHVLILDSAVSGRYPVGSVIEFSKEEFHKIHSGSPHFIGIPEALTIAEKLNVTFPRVIRVLAMEIGGSQELREGLSAVIQRSLPNFVNKAAEVINEWVEEVGAFKEFFERPETLDFEKE